MLSLSTGRGRLVTPTTQLYMVGTEDTYYFTVSTQNCITLRLRQYSFFLAVLAPNRHYLTTKNDHSRWYPSSIAMGYLSVSLKAHRLRTSTARRIVSLLSSEHYEFLLEISFTPYLSFCDTLVTIDFSGIESVQPPKWVGF